MRNPVTYPREDSYVTIPGWMRWKLGLKGEALLIYAIIHGFSQDGESVFKGSANYLAEWCGCSTDTVYRRLTELYKRKLIDRRIITPQGNHYGKCIYYDYWTIESRTQLITKPQKKGTHNHTQSAAG